jgi:hypothetical protein
VFGLSQERVSTSGRHPRRLTVDRARAVPARARPEGAPPAHLALTDSGQTRFSKQFATEGATRTYYPPATRRPVIDAAKVAALPPRLAAAVGSSSDSRLSGDLAHRGAPGAGAAEACARPQLGPDPLLLPLRVAGCLLPTLCPPLGSAPEAQPDLQLGRRDPDEVGRGQTRNPRSLRPLPGLALDCLARTPLRPADLLPAVVLGPSRRQRRPLLLAEPAAERAERGQAQERVLLLAEQSEGVTDQRRQFQRESLSSEG